VRFVRAGIRQFERDANSGLDEIHALDQGRQLPSGRGRSVRPNSIRAVHVTLYDALLAA
jgi:hypothetical protein